MRRLPAQEDTTKLGVDRGLQLRSVDGRRAQRNDGVVLGGLVRKEALREQCAVRVGAERAAAAARCDQELPEQQEEVTAKGVVARHQRQQRAHRRTRRAQRHRAQAAAPVLQL